MHMADALLSPTVGATMLAASAGLTFYSAGRLKEDQDSRRVPLMGVLGAFIFAAQMINFTIPGTGSSGHLGGGMILAILLGTHASFLTMASILIVQALFFADGGLLALGCNIFNLGFIPSFIAYPIIFKKLAGNRATRGRIMVGSIAASIIGLQIGALGVVLETIFSDVSELPFSTFALLIQPIHLVIGVVEGIVTAAVVTFIWKERPELIEVADSGRTGEFSIRRLAFGLLVIAAITGGALSWFASTDPDGLEWSIFHASGKKELTAPANGLHAVSAKIQEQTALLPDYDFKKSDSEQTSKREESRARVNMGTSASGLLGASMTMVLAILIGLGLRRINKR